MNNIREPEVINEKIGSRHAFLLGGSIGFIIGIIVTLASVMIIRTGLNIVSEEPKSYFDVQLDGEVYHFYTGMPKDSVIQLLGYPESTYMYKFMWHTNEDMTFNRSYDQINIKFEDGKLKEYFKY